MRIRERIIFGIGSILSIGSAITGVYYTVGQINPFASVPLIFLGGACFALSCAKVLDREEGEIEINCDYHNTRQLQGNVQQQANQEVELRVRNEIRNEERSESRDPLRRTQSNRPSSTVRLRVLENQRAALLSNVYLSTDGWSDTLHIHASEVNDIHIPEEDRNSHFNLEFLRTAEQREKEEKEKLDMERRKQIIEEEIKENSESEKQNLTPNPGASATEIELQTILPPGNLWGSYRIDNLRREIESMSDSQRENWLHTRRLLRRQETEEQEYKGRTPSL